MLSFPQTRIKKESPLGDGNPTTTKPLFSITLSKSNKKRIPIRGRKPPNLYIMLPCTFIDRIKKESPLGDGNYIPSLLHCVFQTLRIKKESPLGDGNVIL